MRLPDHKYPIGFLPKACLWAVLWAAVQSSVLPAATGPNGPEPEQSARILIREPEGGLSYRLHIPSTATGKSRLAVWLHPSGGRSYNPNVESLAPIFGRHGFSLLVPTHKDYRGWTYDDARKLLGTTLPDAASLPEIDADRPVLLGFSAGGQVALDLYMTKPELYGGIIVDAAYPVEERDGKDVILAPPDHPSVSGIPLLAFVGSEDPLLIVWQQCKEPWSREGVPLTVRVVPGKGHEWLITGEERDVLDGWLAGLDGAGKRPQAVSPPQEEPAPAVHP